MFAAGGYHAVFCDAFIFNIDFYCKISESDQNTIFYGCSQCNNVSLGHALGGGRVVRWCWVNFQCWGVLQFGLQ